MVVEESDEIIIRKRKYIHKIFLQVVEMKIKDCSFFHFFNHYSYMNVVKVLRTDN